MNILEILASSARERIAKQKEQISFEELKAKALAMEKGDFPFEKALKKPGITFICECKHASPSKGIIEENYDCKSHAANYQTAGADCLSVLTEPTRFLGSDQDLQDARAAVRLPILRKDFTIDPYMIAQAKVLGADAVLLIASLLEESEMREMIAFCDELGLSALCEAHDAAEIEQCRKAGARIIGVNNRNLKDFSVSMDNARNLRKLAGEDVLFVCESGMQSPKDIEAARKMNADAVLIGEAMMKAADKTEKLSQLKGFPIRDHSVKLCGLKTEADVLAANEAKPDAVGFVFCPASKRHIESAKTLKRLKSLIDPGIFVFGVFKDFPEDQILQIASSFDALQLHGYDAKTIEELRLQTGKAVIEAFQIESAEDLEKAKASKADLVLLDANQPGSGSRFDWSLIPADFRDYILAGGLNNDNISQALEQTKALVYDVSSGIEADPPTNEMSKDAFRMKEFVRAVHAERKNKA